MAIRLLLALLILIGVIWGLSWYKKVPPEKRKKALIILALYSLLAALIILVVTGKLPRLFALAAGAFPWIKRALTMKVLWGHFNQKANQQRTTDDTSKAHKTSSSMTVAEAYEILGLQQGATKQEVIDAHKRLMQKNHPDRGGSDYLAKRINHAKDVILKRNG